MLIFENSQKKDPDVLLLKIGFKACAVQFSFPSSDNKSWGITGKRLAFKKNYIAMKTTEFEFEHNDVQV